MADALASGASVRKGVGVQVPPRAREKGFGFRAGSPSGKIPVRFSWPGFLRPGAGVGVVVVVVGRWGGSAARCAGRMCADLGVCGCFVARRCVRVVRGRVGGVLRWWSCGCGLMQDSSEGGAWLNCWRGSGAASHVERPRLRTEALEKRAAVGSRRRELHLRPRSGIARLGRRDHCGESSSHLTKRSASSSSVGQVASSTQTT